MVQQSCFIQKTACALKTRGSNCVLERIIVMSHPSGVDILEVLVQGFIKNKKIMETSPYFLENMDLG